MLSHLHPYSGNAKERTEDDTSGNPRETCETILRLETRETFEIRGTRETAIGRGTERCFHPPCQRGHLFLRQLWLPQYKLLIILLLRGGRLGRRGNGGNAWNV